MYVVCMYVVCMYVCMYMLRMIATGNIKEGGGAVPRAG